MSNPRLGSSSQLRTDQRGSQHRPPRHMQSQSVKGQAVSGQLLIAASGQIPHNRHKCSGTQLNEPDQLRTDLVIVFVFTRVEFAALWLLSRRDVARPLKSLEGYSDRPVEVQADDC